MGTFEDGNKQQGNATNPYLAVKQKLRPAGSEKLQQQHKHQYQAVVNDSSSSYMNDTDKLGSYSFSSSSRTRRNSAGSSTRRSSQKSSWKSMLNAVYSLVYTVFFHVMLLVIAFAIGFFLPTSRFLQGVGSKETLLVQASSAILLSIFFTQGQKMKKKLSGNHGTSYRSLDPSDPTTEYINVRERLRKSSMTLKQQKENNSRSHSGSGAAKETTSITMRCFFFLYSCLSFMSLVATCGAIGFYCHQYDDDMIWTITTTIALTLWFQQCLALIWQTAFGIGYYFYFNNHYEPDPYLMQQAVMVLMTVLSILLLTAVAELVCGQFCHQDHYKSSKPVVHNGLSIWTRFASRPSTAASGAPTSPSASFYDDNPRDPYAQVRQQLRKSPTNNAKNISSIAAMQAPTAVAPAYTDVRQKLHHVEVPDTDESESNNTTSPVVKAHVALAKAKEASRDLGLENTMELLMQQKSRLDAISGTTELEPAAITQSSRGLLKASPIAVKGKVGSRDLKLEETMRICLEQKSQLKKHGVPK